MLALIAPQFAHDYLLSLDADAVAQLYNLLRSFFAIADRMHTMLCSVSSTSSNGIDSKPRVTSDYACRFALHLGQRTGYAT
jgi:hypothetical protein